MRALVALLVVGPSFAGEVRFAFAPNPGTLPIYAAQERGYFLAEGVQVRIVECRFGRECLRQLMDGKADLATVADLPLVLAAFSKQPFVVLATMNTNRNDTKVVARRSTAINGTRDLVGKRVGTLLGTTAQYALDSLLLFDGVDPASVQLVDLPVAELRSALLARRVDAVAVFEPWASEIAEAVGADALTLDMKRIYTQTWNLVAASSPISASRSDSIAVLRALRRASAWIASDPPAARALLQRRLGISAELTEASWPSLTFALTLKQSLLTTLDGEARWALRLGLVQGMQPNFLEHLDAGPLRAVDKDAVTLAQ